MSDSTPGDKGPTSGSFIDNRGANFHGQVFQGQYLYLSGDVLNAAGADAKALRDSAEALDKALGAVPSQHAESRDAVAATAKSLVAEAEKPQPNKTLLKVLADTVTATAQAVKEYAPAVLTTASMLVNTVLKIRGMLP